MSLNEYTSGIHYYLRQDLFHEANLMAKEAHKAYDDATSGLWAAFAAFNSQASVHFLKDKPDIPDNIFEKDDTLYKQINFYPVISIEEGIKKIAEWRAPAGG